VQSVPAVKRALKALELLVSEGRPLTLSEIATRTQVPTASCHAIMHTLLESGYVTRRIEGRTQYWEPTLTLYHLGATIVSRVGIREIALPHLRDLSAALDLPAHLGVLVGSEVMYLEKAATPSFIQFDTFPGKLSPYHLTALGRAIAAALPDDQRSRLIDGHGPRLKQLLTEARKSGFAVEDGEEIEGVGCVAAPIFGPDGQVLASVGITGFSRDLFVAGEVPSASAVMDAARAISAELGYRSAESEPIQTRG
jgi:DNA-binding IclR family transcriptional regulator